MQSASSTHQAAPTGLPVPQDIRALLLDDSTFDRQRIRRMSDGTKLPLHLDEVGSIEELDRVVREETYDLILIDYRLPVGDGMVALDRIHHSPQNRNAGKIMITGNEAIGTAVEAMRAGCHDFLSKDQMDAETLKAAMLNAMTAAHQRALVPISETEAYRDMIRDSLVEALQDKDVQGSVLSLMKGSFSAEFSAALTQERVTAAQDLETLLSGFASQDDFLFH